MTDKTHNHKTKRELLIPKLAATDGNSLILRLTKTGDCTNKILYNLCVSLTTTTLATEIKMKYNDS